MGGGGVGRMLGRGKTGMRRWAGVVSPCAAVGRSEIQAVDGSRPSEIEEQDGRATGSQRNTE